MPCRDEGADADLLNSRNRELEDLKARVCRACKVLEAKGIPIPGSLAGWWLGHKNEDAKRRLDMIRSAEHKVESLKRSAEYNAEEIKKAENDLRRLLGK